MNRSYLAIAALSACAGSVYAQSPVTVYSAVTSNGVVERSCEGCGQVMPVSSLMRPYAFEYSALTDVGEAFAGQQLDTIGMRAPRSNKRVSSTFQYYSRDSDSLSATIAPAARSSGNRAWGMSLGLEKGGVMLRVAHQNRNVARVAPAMSLGNTLDAKNTIVAANVQVGIGKVYAAYSASRGWGNSPLWNPDNPYSASLASTSSTDSRDVLVGLAVPFGQTTLLASFIRKNDRDLANRDARQIALGAAYSVSRRTDFYAAYSHTRTLSGAGFAVDRAGVPGSGSSAINLGMRHAF